MMRGSVEVITDGEEGPTMQDLRGISRQLVHQTTNLWHYTANFVLNCSLKITLKLSKAQAVYLSMSLPSLHYTALYYTTARVILMTVQLSMVAVVRL